jgi:hypothetical protein
VNKKGEVIDGKHRLRADRRWPRLELDLDDLETHVARLKINAKRRIADRRDYNELAAYLRRSEPENKSSLVQRIAKLTGIPVPTIYPLLDEEYKRPYEDSKSIVTIKVMPTQPIRIPEPVAASVKQAVSSLQQLVKEEPKKRDEIVRNFKRHMDFTQAMSAPTPKPIQLPPDRDKRTDTSDQFMLSITRLTAATEFLKPIPTAMLTKIVQDMESEQRKRFDKLAGIILANTLKLQGVIA